MISQIRKSSRPSPTNFLVTRRSDKFAMQSMRSNQIHSQSVQGTTGTISSGVQLVLVSGSLSAFPDSWIGHSRPFSWSLYSCPSLLRIFFYWVHSGPSACQPCAWFSNIMSPQLSWQETEHKIDIICATWNSLLPAPTVMPFCTYKFFQFIVCFQLLYFFQSDDLKWGRFDKDNLYNYQPYMALQSKRLILQ